MLVLAVKALLRRFGLEVSRIRPSTSRWDQRMQFLELFPDTGDVVMLGDSLTEGADWRAMFPSASIANRGVYGDTAEGVLFRVPNALATGAKRAFVMVGINDLRNGLALDTIFFWYAQIIDRLKDAGVDVFAQSVLLTADRDLNPRVVAFNACLRSLCAAKNANFIDLNTRLAPDGVMPDHLAPDGLHLAPLGYYEWREALRPYLN